MHYFKKVFILLCLVVIFFAVLKVYFKKDIVGKAQEDTKEDKIIIGFAMDTLVHERWLRDRDILVSRANELGAEVIVQTANSDGEEQKKQVQYLLDQNIDVLVLVPHDAESAASIVKAAKNKGVKVISYDRLVKKANVDLYISFDNIKVGELMGQAAMEAVPEGNYLILNGSESDNNSFMFNEGYKNVLGDSIRSGKINIVSETWVKDWLYEDAFKFVDEVLHTDTEINAIIAANDTLASAAVNALAERRLAGKVAVIGHDADLDACQRIVEGIQVATIYKPIDKIAKIAVEYAINMAKGGLVQTDEKIYDGKYYIPYYRIEPVLVTKENMVDVIIEDKFHALEDVYMNIPKSQRPQVD
ncbi:substrate-binding domain-containing protein [Defluviitalea saccharophila]|uniref:Substrate-binding domain-containing protein n=1 Tax=Defluviitalea saccharophila TaxID=879970 RepID=A0ABZ2Y4V9_9FIRM|nr:sugar ABC transporter substrate-binding protein [Candidatus Epulonipiscium sp.]